MIDTPVHRTGAVPPVRERDDEPPPICRDDIPPTFYDDDELPPPPPDDPHWHEWWQNDGYEHPPRWLVIGLPVALLCAAVFHFALLLLVLQGGM